MSNKFNVAALDAARNTPNAQKFLNFLAQAEGTAKQQDPYTVGFGGTTLPNLAAHPGNSLRRQFTQTDGKKNTSTAAGKYQFMPKTWAGVQKKLGLEDFGPRSQDLGALELIREKGALNDVLNGDFGAAISKLGKMWASLPSSTYPQHKRSAAWVEKALGMALPGLGSSPAATNATAPGKAVGGPVVAGNQQGNTQMAQAQENAPEASVANPMVDMAQVMGMDPVAMLASLGSGATTLTPNQQLQYLAGLQNDAALVQLAQMGQA